MSSAPRASCSRRPACSSRAAPSARRRGSAPLRRRLVEGGESFGDLARRARPRPSTPRFSPRRPLGDASLLARAASTPGSSSSWLPAGQRSSSARASSTRRVAAAAEAVAAWETGSCSSLRRSSTPCARSPPAPDDVEPRFTVDPRGAGRARAPHRVSSRHHPASPSAPRPSRPPPTRTATSSAARELVVIDPGSPYDDERAALDELLDTLVGGEGRRVREIVAHPPPPGPHRRRQPPARAPRRSGRRAPASRPRPSSGRVRVDRIIEDGERIELEGPPQLSLRALHTPGHARGHLCFFEERTALSSRAT